VSSQEILEYVVGPIVVAVIVWAITGRRKDQAAIRQLLAQAGKETAEGRVVAGTVAAAIELADVGTLQAHVAAMAAAFREERESLERRLEDAQEAAQACQRAVAEMRADLEHSHREMIDMYRRDQHHARQLQELTEWLTANLPKMRRAYPQLDDPPPLEPLPPLLVPQADDDGVPHRRWYDADSPG